MAEKFISVKVDTKQAQKNFELVTDKVIDQERNIAKLKETLVKTFSKKIKLKLISNYIKQLL